MKSPFSRSLVLVSQSLRKVGNIGRKVVSIQAKSKRLGTSSRWIGEGGKFNKGKLRIGWSKGTGNKWTFRMGRPGKHNHVWTHHSNIRIN